MREERTLCDRCKSAGAEHFSIFKDRRTDGAGSGENWYYTFDLCGMCTGALLKMMFGELGQQKLQLTRTQVIDMLSRLKVKVSEG